MPDTKTNIPFVVVRIGRGGTQGKRACYAHFKKLIHPLYNGGNIRNLKQKENSADLRDAYVNHTIEVISYGNTGAITLVTTTTADDIFITVVNRGVARARRIHCGLEDTALIDLLDKSRLNVGAFSNLNKDTLETH